MKPPWGENGVRESTAPGRPRGIALVFALCLLTAPTLLPAESLEGLSLRIRPVALELHHPVAITHVGDGTGHL